MARGQRPPYRGPMSLTSRRGGRELAAECVPFLDAWAATQPFRAHLHSGDLGWHLRFDDATVDGTVLCWSDDGGPVAVGLLDGGVLRLALAPSGASSSELAVAIADDADGVGYVDAPSGTALRDHLVQAGWSADPDPWVLLFKELGEADARLTDPGTRPAADDVEGRVAVQRSAFAPGSTFTPGLWQRMAEQPSYDRLLDLVTYTPDGEPAAAATGWSAGPGAVAILEPVGTHQDHRRQGYGRRVNLAVMAALARGGAGGVRVQTPASNGAAVSAYESCGLRQVDWATAVMRG
jgi:ribosomal protein S18 acetylase RimI-like enzyme